MIERDKVREHLRQRGLGPEPHRPKQRETPSDCDAYAPVPEEDWDQRNEGSDEETSLSDADVPKTIFDDG